MTATQKPLRLGPSLLGSSLALSLLFAGCTADPGFEGDGEGQEQTQEAQTFTANVSYHPTKETDYDALGIMYFKMGAMSAGCAAGKYRVGGSTDGELDAQICDRVSVRELDIYAKGSTEPLITFSYRTRGKLRYLTPKGGSEIEMQPRSLGTAGAFMKVPKADGYSEFTVEDLNAVDGELAYLRWDPRGGASNTGYVPVDPQDLSKGTTFEHALKFACAAAVVGKLPVTGAECSFYTTLAGGDQAVGLRILSGEEYVYDKMVVDALPLERQSQEVQGKFEVYKIYDFDDPCPQYSLCLEGTIIQQDTVTALSVGGSTLGWDYTLLDTIDKDSVVSHRIEKQYLDSSCEMQPLCGASYEPRKVLIDNQIPEGLGWPNR